MSDQPPPLPTPPPLPAQAPPAVPVEPSPPVASVPPRPPKSYRRTKRLPWIYALPVGVLVVTGVFIVTDGFGIGGGDTGLKSVRYVSSETDDAGRIVSTTFAVDYEVAARGRETESCDFEFFDRDGKKLELQDRPLLQYAGGGTERVRVRQQDGSYRTETRNKTAQFRDEAQLTVKGVPAKVSMRCF